MVSSFYIQPRPQDSELEAEEKLTKEEITARLEEILKDESDIIATIPGLESKRDEAGSIYYEYNGIRLKELDEKTLFELLGTVEQRLSLKHQQELLRQLETIRQMENINRTQRTIRELTPPRIPTVPTSSTPPSIPEVPESPQPQRR